MPAEPIHVAVALDGAGWHPASWREPAARTGELFTASYWLDLVREAERGLLDFVTIEDALRLQSAEPLCPDERTDQARGRLDALLICARVAPRTKNIGLVPTVIVTHTEPFHISAAIATLDYISTGRAGVRVEASPARHEARHFGRRTLLPFRIEDRNDPVLHIVLDQLIADQSAETSDYVEVLRRLWDSWEDDAKMRDPAGGCFIDLGKLHQIDFIGRWFSVKGPSIMPRPPQGQPIVSVLSHEGVPRRLIAQATDVGFVTPRDAAHAREIVAEVRAEQAAAGRADETLHVFADLVVFLDDSETAASARKELLDGRDGAEYISDATIFTGTPVQLADLLVEWQEAGLSGFRLRPGTLPGDLTRITRGLVPELQRRGRFRTRYEASTLRGLLGMARPVSRYATAEKAGR